MHISNGFPLVFCVHFSPKGTWAPVLCMAILMHLIFLSCAVGEVPAEKNNYDMTQLGNLDMTQLGKIRGGIRSVTSANLSAHLERIPNTHW